MLTLCQIAGEKAQVEQILFTQDFSKFSQHEGTEATECSLSLSLHAWEKILQVPAHVGCCLLSTILLTFFILFNFIICSYLYEQMLSSFIFFVIYLDNNFYKKNYYPDEVSGVL